MKRFVIAAAVAAGLLALVAPPAHAAGSKPDGLIKEPEGSFLGNNVYNGTGEDQRQCTSGALADFVVKFQNDGVGKDKYTVFAFFDDTSTLQTTITYKGEDVTQAAIDQTLRLNRIKPGEKTKPLEIETIMTGRPGESGQVVVGAHSNLPDIVKAQWANSGFCTL